MIKNHNKIDKSEISAEEIDIIYKLVWLIIRNNPSSGMKLINWTTFFSNLGI